LFNLFPGQGLGGWSFEEIIRYIIIRLIAFGLGFPLFPPEPEPVVVDQNLYGGGGKKAYVPRFDWDDIIGDIKRRELIQEDDEQILEIIINALATGVID
jgi:hypothetical protein